MRNIKQERLLLHILYVHIIAFVRAERTAKVTSIFEKERGYWCALQNFESKDNIFDSRITRQSSSEL